MPAGVHRQDKHQEGGQAHHVHTLKWKAVASPGLGPEQALQQRPAQICRMNGGLDTWVGERMDG